jgi:hypothetical protein
MVVFWFRDVSACVGLVPLHTHVRYIRNNSVIEVSIANPFWYGWLENVSLASLRKWVDQQPSWSRCFLHVTWRAGAEPVGM